MDRGGLSARDVFSTLPQLEVLFNPNNIRLRAIQNAVVVSLDLEHESNPPLIHQIGLSVLDTRHLSSIDVEDLQSVAPSVSNHLFLLTRKPYRAYCYGDPLLEEDLSLEEILRPFLAIKDEKGQPRDVVPVGHSIHNDLSMLEKCGLDLNSLTQIRACIDIAPICTHVLDDVTHDMSLKHMCRRFEIRTVSFHNAAHDALYTLQALLMPFCLYKDEMLASPDIIVWMPQDRREADPRTLWEAQLEILRFVGKELGNLLWIGSPKNRQRKQQRKAYLRRLQSCTGVSDNSLKRTATSGVDWIIEGWPLEPTD